MMHSMMPSINSKQQSLVTKRSQLHFLRFVHCDKEKHILELPCTFLNYSLGDGMFKIVFK